MVVELSYAWPLVQGSRAVKSNEYGAREVATYES
jgi:hypothetical protein